mmetsp:Transcript_23677/g.48520  ORF Transcript_23677/g.48520 Transcript_23677/m.48520 type:complete len:376 (+) Transcript_23677:722-1849(+)
MCKPETLLKEKDDRPMKSSPSLPPVMQVPGESDLSGSDSDDANDSNSNDRRRQRKMRQLSSQQSTTANNESFSSSALTGILHGVVWIAIAENLPVILSGREVYDKIYRKAFFDYDAEISVFDNTIWTYGTDYAIFAMAVSVAYWILRTSNPATSKLSRMSALMLVLYSISTGAGAIAHHFFLTVESRRTLEFRVLWTICVGSVFLAPIAMGIIGSECVAIFQRRSDCPAAFKRLPYLTDVYWIFYGAVGTIVCICGGMSFQRPACDIFIAGITQSPCTAYCMAILYLVKHPGITNGDKGWGLLGFIMNAFLLPLYPILVETFGWSLAGANTLMHTNLFVAWFLQGRTMQRIVKSLVEEEEGLYEHQENNNKTKVQ